MSEGVDTACPQGHKYTKLNGFFSIDGERVCRTCQRKKWLRMKEQFIAGNFIERTGEVES